MKIKSKFSDYYDSLSFVYGQDPKVFYKREFTNLDDTSNYHLKKDIDTSIFNYYMLRYFPDYEFRWIIICGKGFLIAKLGKAWHFVEEHDERFKISRKYFISKFSYDIIKIPKLLKINLDLGCPICVVTTNIRNDIKCIGASPILGDISGFVKMYPSEQIYQDICDFFLNTLAGSPDADPPVEIEDKYKIIGHGFDKLSFKHRKR